jgi:hypothetical protein
MKRKFNSDGQQLHQYIKPKLEEEDTQELRKKIEYVNFVI